MRIYLIAAIAALLHFVSAGAMTVSGDISLLPTPPVAAGPGELVSRNSAFAWTEGRNLSLLDPLFVDIIPFQNSRTGMYKSGRNSVQSRWSGTVAPGRYDSFIVHADKSGKKVIFSGSITFDTDIIGIIFKTQTLSTTDFLLGAIGTNYADATNKHGIELRGANNWFSISTDRRTLEFQSVVTRNMDELRILTNTSATAVPLPASIWMFGSALCLLTWIKRRSDTSV